nr:hypothetical protein [Tanacetum cinerariifolium]
SHPPKKVREDHGTPSGPLIAGKSRFAVQRFIAGAVLNDEVRGDPIPTLPFVTSSVSVTPEREGEDHTDSVFCSSDDSCYYHPLMADPDVIVKEKITKPSVFSADSSSTGGADPNAGIFLILPK